MEKARRVLVVVGVAVLVGAAAVGIYFLRGDGNGYRTAERAHDAQFGEYVDVTFIGHDERVGDALLIVSVLNKPMPDDLYFNTYSPFMADWILGIVKNEPGVVLLLYSPEENAIMVIALLPTELGTSGTLNGGILSYEIAQGPLEEKYLVWRDE